MSDSTTHQTSRDEHQHLIDALQVIAPLAQRLCATSRQQQIDAEALLDATRRAITLIRKEAQHG